jgi:hypothetical protein
MEKDNGGVQKLETPVSNLGENVSGKWWETSDGHRFAGEVLQLRV